MLPPTGPFAVGCRDFSWRRLEGSPQQLDAHNNLTGRLFYPALAGAKGRSSARWVQHYMYAKGYVTFAFFSAKSLKWRLIKNMLQGAVWATGALTHLPVAYNAPLAPPGADPFPVIVFSPGAAANRNTYSSVCTELASRGCVVAAVEHADGSSGAAQLADGSWRLFAGLGTGPVLESKCEYRVAEVLGAAHIMRALNQGGVSEGTFTLSGDGKGGGDPAMFQGSLDLFKMAVVGHSCGGATAALAASRGSEFAAAVALDPWWPILPTGSPALEGWAAGVTTPLQIIGSEAWNTEGLGGSLPCDGPRQEAVLRAARHRDGPNAGGGALLLVPSHTKHHSFSDVPALLEGNAAARRLLALMGFKPQPVSAAASLRLICECTTRFLRAHFAAGGAWPAAGGAAEAAAEAEAAAGAAAAAKEAGGGAPAGAGSSGGSTDEEGMVMDEAGESKAEAHARRAEGRANGNSGGGATAIDVAPEQQPGGGQQVKAAAHIRVSEAERATYAKFQEEGLLRKLEVYA